jgi:cytosine/creatinine deaminase
VKRDAQSSLTWSGARLPGGDLADIVVVDGRIRSVGAPGSRTPEPARDVRGYVVLPRLVDAHVHLDKTLLGDRWHPHHIGSTISERIDAERRLLESARVAPLRDRSNALLARLSRNGVSALRSHIDISATVGLSHLESLLESRIEWAGRMTIEFVAFPQEGVIQSPGTASLLREALRAGCDVVGGLDPEDFDGDRNGQLDFLVSLAGEYDAPIDLHLHERGTVGEQTIKTLCALTNDAGLTGKVALSHAFCLADLFRDSQARFDALCDELVASEISIVTSLPVDELRPPITPLLSRGVRVIVASDNIRDAWSPFGKADPLERACLAAYLEGWRTDEQLARALRLVSSHPARLLGLEEPNVMPGSEANLVFVRADSLQEAIVAQPEDRIAVVKGQVV